MARLRGRFHFRTRGLLVSRSLLGTSHVLPHETRTVTLWFPVDDSELDEEDLIETALLRAAKFPPDEPPPKPAASIEISNLPTERDLFALVHVLRLDVDGEFPYGVADVRAEKGSDVPLEILHELCDDAQRLARAFVESARVRGRQPWLGISGEGPTGIGAGKLFDLDENAIIPASIGLRGSEVMLTKESDALDDDRLRAVIDGAVAAPSLADSLLTDAAYYEAFATPKDPTRALLISAVACEIKVKECLRRVVRPESQELLEVLLESPRDFSLAAFALFDKAARAACGRSLKDENKELHKRVNSLFELRNKIAHRGASTTPEQAAECLRSAVEAFRWLRDVEANARPGG